MVWVEQVFSRIFQKGCRVSRAVPGAGRSWTQIEIVLSLAILVFALVISILQTILMLKLDINWTPMSILRFNGLTLIIAGGLLLVTAGYSNQQIAPVMGLLGAVAGYLLGSRDGGKGAADEAQPGA